MRVLPPLAKADMGVVVVAEVGMLLLPLAVAGMGVTEVGLLLLPAMAGVGKVVAAVPRLALVLCAAIRFWIQVRCSGVNPGDAASTSPSMMSENSSIG